MSQKTIIILSPVLKIPSHMEKEITVLNMDLPRVPDILSIQNDLLSGMPFTFQQDRAHDEILAKNLLGLTFQEVENAISRSFVECKSWGLQNLKVLLEDKENIIKKQGILEFIKSKETIESLAGNENIKRYFRLRQKAFSQEAKDFGIPRPRGIISVGVPGTGKSLSAKVLANFWNLPLVKLDAGKILGSLVGESESKFDSVLLTLESIAPCVLLIDEISRLFGGMLQGGNLDSGVGNRIAGKFLNWLQESQEEIFVIGTSNELEGIPPEFTARFDEIFFVDYPSEIERRDIFSIHLQKRGRSPKEFNLSLLAAKSDHFSGREIERSIVDSLFEAFDEGTSLQDRHILESLKAAKTMWELNKDKLQSLKTWAKSRCKFASIPEEEKASSLTGRVVEI